MEIRRLTPHHLVSAAARRLSSFSRLERAGRVSRGVGTYGTPKVEVFFGDSNTRLVIGNYCSVASTATFLLGGEHPTDRYSTFPIRQRLGVDTSNPDGFPTSRGDILIGNDVWIGHEALILSGIRIGDGAVVGARSVVTRDVDPYTVVAGNPAKYVKRRFDAATEDHVRNLRWWEWSPDEVKKNADLLNGPISRTAKPA